MLPVTTRPRTDITTDHTDGFFPDVHDPVAPPTADALPSRDGIENLAKPLPGIWPGPFPTPLPRPPVFPSLPDPVFPPPGLVKAQTLVLTTNRLATAAADPKRFDEILTKAFGPDFDRAAAEELRQKLVRGDMSWMPKLEYVSSRELQGAGGAYAADSGTVYLSRDLRTPQQGARVLLEELGHHIDTLIKRSDSRGDEGEIFARLVGGEALSDETIARLQAENDHGLAVINGRAVEVENFFGFNPIQWIFGTPAVKDVWKDTQDRLRGMLNSFSVQVNAAAKGWMEDLIANAKAYGTQLVQSAETVARGFQKLSRGDIGGAMADIASGLASSSFEQFHAFARLTLDTVSAVQVAVGIEPIGRRLRDDEIAKLRAIYGDSINYAAVTVKEGGAGVFAGGRALTMGNTIYMKDHKAFETLVHEMGHVWQFQNGGNDYMLKAGWAQFSNWLGGNDKHVAYDWTRDIGRGFAALNPEQQAEMIENIASWQNVGGTWVEPYSDRKAAWDTQWAPYMARELNYQLRGIFGGGNSPGRMAERAALDVEKARLLAIKPTFVLGVNGVDYTAQADDALNKVRNRQGAP